ncbi:MAG: cyclic nucleotide-binding domain-containing protein [Deltaproteobacteria bacterium]|nr:cyclic nucleotide-binding domain-containing protein [Deltaproteobacteria bacterium]
MARVDVFAGLTPRALELVSSIAVEKTFKRGTVLFRAGEPGDRLFVIVEGKVRISREVPGMGEEALAIFGPGESFGELSLIDDAPRNADAHAHENCVLLELRKDALEHLLYLDKDLAYEVLWNMIRTLASRLRETTDKVTFLAVTGKFS